MMGINFGCLEGNLGDDPEIRYSQSGGAVVKFRLAVTEPAGKNDDGSWKEPVTNWFNLVWFGEHAKGRADGLHKGDRVHFMYKLKTRSYIHPQSGERRYSTDLEVTQATLSARARGGQTQEVAEMPSETVSDPAPF